ncbi:hypothetical protein ACFL27_19520 [candidate division CSSED10-310 bacterium]|uniref:Uncharacterized protein n=1 Tax=candidate division CSSED10-310 bacterium TaxID=2855610 RepID=A0ABV6Z1U3_UNCC1
MNDILSHLSLPQVSKMMVPLSDFPFKYDPAGRLPVGWYGIGDRSLLSRPKVAFLISRQGRKLTPRTWWFQAIRAVSAEIFSHRYVPLVTTGIFYHDVIRHVVAQSGASILVLSSKPSPDTALPLENTLILYPESKDGFTKQERYIQRDEIMAEKADLLIGIVIRRDGFMVQLGLKALRSGKEVLLLKPPRRNTATAGYDVLLKAGAHPWAVEVNLPAAFNFVKPDRSTICFYQNFTARDEYLWHYTRAHPGPWPQQTWSEYIRTLLENEKSAAHSARDTLANILAHQRIDASGAMIRGKYPVVCFSSRDPHAIVKLQKYNPALQRWNFQPYGIGIKKEKAISMGFRAVSYGSADTFDSLPAEERYLFQRQQTARGTWDWSKEKEWRQQDNVDLLQVSPQEALVLVKNMRDVSQIQPCSRFPILVFEP